MPPFSLLTEGSLRLTLAIISFTAPLHANSGQLWTHSNDALVLYS